MFKDKAKIARRPSIHHQQHRRGYRSRSGQRIAPVASHGRIIGPAKNVATGNAYNGINVVALWATAQERGYSYSLWGTYKQLESLDAQVRKGAKVALFIFYKEYDVEPDAEQ